MQKIINYLIEKRGYNFKGFRKKFIEELIIRRMELNKQTGTADYLSYLKENPSELIELIHGLIIPVSRFFRNPLTFELIYNYTLPNLLVNKKNEKEVHFRFWSAGCSNGEEPYSLAIILKEIFKNEKRPYYIESFATDINKSALEFAKKGVYGYDSIKNIRYEWLRSYFQEKDSFYMLLPEIKETIFFSYHDLRNEKNIVPPESIFGYFDLVFCCNVLIYYELDVQQKILNNLINSLASGGYLVLGESESILTIYHSKVKKIYHSCSIYQKI